jgi:plastocyanin
MTDATITDDEATDEALDDDVEAADAGDVDEAGDGGDGSGQLELAGPLEPESPIKDRLLLPLVLPWLCVLAVGLYTLNISRIFLAGDSTSALIIGSLVTVGILAGAAIISASPRLRTSSLAMIMGFVLVIIVSGGLLTLGPSLESGEGATTGYVKPKGQPTSTVKVTAGPGTTFDGVKFTMNYTAKAGVIEIDYGGATGHNLVFTDPNLAGFELETAGQQKGNVELKKPGKYIFYCNVTGHRAQGMQATLTVQ